MLSIVRSVAGIILVGLLLPASGQVTSVLRPVRVVLASTKFQVSADKPLHFSLLDISIPAGATATFAGGAGFVFVSSGKVEIAVGAEKVELEGGGSKYLSAGTRATVRASGPRPASVMHYLLASASPANENTYSGAAAIKELFRSKDPVPLSAGPHEFSLTRVTSPVNAPAPPLHHRSGAALYRVLSGNGAIHFQGKVEPRDGGAVQYEPNGFIHTWENIGKVPLVLLQANISAEGAPEIIWIK